MAAKITVRLAEPGDAARVSDLGARTFGEAFAAQNSPEDMKAYLRESFSPDIQRAEIVNPRWRTLIAEIENVPVGYAQVCDDEAPDCVYGLDNCVELRRIYVDQAWHGKNAGTVLMAAAKDAARELGATSMWLGVWEINDAAQRFYARHGFRKVGQKIFQVGSDPQQDDVLLCELE